MDGYCTGFCGWGMKIWEEGKKCVEDCSKLTPPLKEYDTKCVASCPAIITKEETVDGINHCMP